MRVFVEPARLIAGELALRDDEHHYVSRARRARVGDALEVVDGAGRRADARIVRMTDAETVVLVEAPAVVVSQPPHVTALLPHLKGERMDYAIEKLVEVGVDAIVVWPAARSVVKLDADRRAAREAKLAAAAQAAARQSGRAQVPTVVIADSLAAALTDLPAARFVLDPLVTDPIHRPTEDAGVAIASGPEGGFAPEELERLAAAGFVGVGLGPRVLRAETAPVVAVALVRALTGT